MTRFTWGLIACTLLGAPALAQECPPLKTLSTIALQPTASRLEEMVPVKINGQDERLILDTGGYTTQLTAQAAADLKLPVSGSLIQLKDVRGKTRGGSVAVSSFEMGSMRAHDVSLMMMGDEDIGPALNVDGLLSNDMFLAYDVDMDFGHDKLNIISSDHCPGKVVYWPTETLAEVPMHIVNGHYLVDVTLDGHRMVALLDTGATRTTMGAGEAQKYFGLTPATMQIAPNTNGTLATYTHKFSSMALDGIEIHDPNIAVVQSGILERQRSPAGANVIGNLPQPWDMVLGMDIMRHLHIYVATKERKVYITPA